MAVVAPTGVAAINAGGVTIHSFFQLPLSPFIPETKGFSNSTETVSRNSLISRLRFNSEKRKVLQQLELLIVDEISMVRCDVLDAIDTVLRYIRKRPYERFGGAQVLFIGDMYQLPPVIKEPEWNILAGFYNSPFFFDSHIIKEELPLYIEFDKIYRQSEETFIRLLNQVRNNEVDTEGMKIIESRYRPEFRYNKDDGYIILTTHNESARNINSTELNRLAGKIYKYEATIEDDFPENSFPADKELLLKIGAQVMFIKNDTAERGKRYFNGKIGIVTKLEDDKIFVHSKDEPGEIEVSKEQWENIRYTLNKASQTMEEEVLGSFTQFPLRLAWAITIHKSQGLTFEKAIIDAGAAFAPGQIYVALSRCTSLDGLVLKSKLRTNSLFTDQRIVQFSKNISSSLQLQQELEAAKKQYQEKLLVATFDFRLAINNANELGKYVRENNSSFNPETIPWLEQLLEKLNSLQDTALKFHHWLKEQFLLLEPPEENIMLQERRMRASAHFAKEIDLIFTEIQRSPAITDSKLHAKEYNAGLKEVFSELSAAEYLLQGFSGRFNAEAWHKRKRSFVLPPFNVNAYAGTSQQKTDNPHPYLYMQLKTLRDEICSRKDLPIYIVAGSKTLDEMARYLPQSLSELKKISGFGNAKIKQYGQDFLSIILEYCVENGLNSLINQKSTKKEKREVKNGRADTKAESFRLFNEKKTVSQIAKERNLTTQTIEGHLAFYVEQGEINIEKLMPPEKLVMIEPVIRDFKDGSIVPLKEKLGNEISFGEIRLALAWKAFKEKNGFEQ